VIGADGHHDRGEEMTEFNHELDACGLNCPLPVLRTKKTLDKMASGEVLQIIATDPGDPPGERQVLLSHEEGLRPRPTLDIRARGPA
jgi:hypothetical protein